MKEDITILTAFLLSNIPEIITQEEFDEVKQAIEKLIKGYKELEEKLDNSRKANELLNKTNNELRLEIRTTYSKVVNDIISKFNLGDDFIPKSKLQEKKEELETKKKKYGFASIESNILLNEIQLLKELMED